LEQRDVDVVVAADDAPSPAERTVLALGEAKAGERLTSRHVRRLEEARAVMGPRAGGARLLLFGQSFDEQCAQRRSGRADLELVDLTRLYGGG
jgi:hypothetical protein